MAESPPRCRTSAVDFPAMADAENENEAIVFEFADETEGTNPIAPEFSEAGPLQGFAQAARVFGKSHAFPKEF